MNTDIFLNGDPMVWITVDESYNPDTGDCRMRAFISPESKDFLMPLKDFDGSVPKGYFNDE